MNIIESSNMLCFLFVKNTTSKGIASRSILQTFSNSHFNKKSVGRNNFKRLNVHTNMFFFTSFIIDERMKYIRLRFVKKKKNTTRIRARESKKYYNRFPTKLPKEKKDKEKKERHSNGRYCQLFNPI